MLGVVATGGLLGLALQHEQVGFALLLLPLGAAQEKGGGGGECTEVVAAVVVVGAWQARHLRSASSAWTARASSPS